MASLTPHDTQYEHEHDEHHNKSDFDAAKDIFKLAKDLLKQVRII